MKSIGNLKTSLVGFKNKAGIKIQKNSPEICLGLGFVGFVGTVVLACRATLKSEEILDRHRARMEDANEAALVAEEDDHFDIRREKTVVWAHTLADFAKIYAPCAAVGAVSVGLLVKSHNILSNRYLGAISAYNAVSEAFCAYRKRVLDEEGAEKDRHYRYGTELKTEKVTKLDENGKKHTETETSEYIDNPVDPSGIARYFDESNPNWNEDPYFNLMFVKGVLRMLDDRLHTVGHVFLNEAYEALGFDHTAMGSVLGWTLDGDGYIDFGLYSDNALARRFVNGKENVVLLDFNVDKQVIWDKI